MNPHPNALVLKKIYADFAAGNIPAVLDVCGETMTFSIPGKNRLSGKYDKKTFLSLYIPTIIELSMGTLKTDAHDILANDQHAVALVVDRLTRNGKNIEYRTVHVWRFENGKPVAWYEYPRDLHQFDEIWS